MPTNIQRLIYAVRKGHLPRVQELLAKMEDLCTRSEGGRTALHAAAESGNLEAARILLKAGIPVDVLTSSGQTPLHLVAGYGRGCDLLDPDLDRRFPCNHHREPVNLKVAEAILNILRQEDNRIPPEIKVMDALPEEIKGHAFSAMWSLISRRKELLAKLEAVRLDVDILDPHFAEMLRGFPRYLEVALFFLDQGADVNAIDEQGETPLHYAVELGQLEMMELLLTRGADPSLRGSNKDWPADYPIQKAIQHYSLPKAKLLQAHGAKLDFDETLPLHIAAENGQVELLLWLLEQGGDINQPDSHGNTPIMSAAQNGHDNVVLALLEKGADLQRRNEEGKNGARLAAGSPLCLRPLLQLGLPANEPDAEGKTALHDAAASLDMESIKALVEMGVNINTKEKAGNTPLHIIFFSDEYRPDVEFPTFQTLVALGSDRTIKNNEGKTAYDLGKDAHYPQEYLDLLNPEINAVNYADHFLWLDQQNYAHFSSAEAYPFEIGGNTYPSVQHYFQSEKWKGAECEEAILTAATPQEAMKIGRRFRQQPPGAWPGKRDEVMRNALKAQFTQHPQLKEKLLETNDKVLIADPYSDWHWHEGQDIPFNAIGRMLMSIREELKG